MLRRCRVLRVSNDVFSGGLPNLTAATNAVGALSDSSKWTSLDPSKQRGVARRVRASMGSIIAIHESSALIVFGRNRCNNFNSNQYLLVSKSTNEGVFIDMADDWPDDWVGFVNESRISVRLVFLTHLHVDNIIGLAPFHRMMPSVPVAWNLAEKYWLEKFPAACRRYGRGDMAGAALPMHRLSADPGSNLLLTSMTTRSTSFIEFGSLGLFYMHTPGHSMGHMMLHVPQEKLLFSGDVIGFDFIGRVDLPMALGSMLGQTLRALEELPDNTVLLPGHGRLTTLARERKCNLGLQRVYELMAAGRSIPSVGFNSAGWL
jgi:glyoxylase-like metal-dependent hydrolase (beta-lactamase superfamily II)